MKNLFGSMTKIVFGLVALTACIGFFMDKITNEQFVGLVTLVFAFYYAKNNPTTPNSSI